jgi:hypothetical protein
MLGNILIEEGKIREAFQKLYIKPLSQLWSYLPSDSPRKFQWVESLPSKKKDP